MQLATRTQMGENRIYASNDREPAARANVEMLDRFKQHRPSLAQVNALVKSCFAGGKPVPNALELIAKVT